jgi:hypothetical protein
VAHELKTANGKFFGFIGPTVRLMLVGMSIVNKLILGSGDGVDVLVSLTVGLRCASRGRDMVRWSLPRLMPFQLGKRFGSDLIFGI